MWRLRDGWPVAVLSRFSGAVNGLAFAIPNPNPNLNPNPNPYPYPNPNPNKVACELSSIASLLQGVTQRSQPKPLP